MKKIVSAVLFVSSISAFAQNYEEINKKNADIINNEYAEAKRANRAKIVKAVVDYTTTLIDIDKSTFPEIKTFDSVELEQIKLLSCVRDLVQDHKGGYDFASVSQGILLKAMEGDNLSTKVEVLNAAEEECHTAYKSLYNFKKKALKKERLANAISALPSETMADKKIKGFIAGLEADETIICKVTQVEAEAYAFVGGGAAVSGLKCLQSDGRVRRYVGTNLKLGLGIGALAGVNVNDTEDYQANLSVADGKVFTAYNRTDDLDFGRTDAALVFGKTIGYNKNDATGIEVGLGFAGLTIAPGLGIRIFNGTTRWQVLLNQLK